MIKSSFKKVQKNVAGQKCSFGHPELDAVLNNNLSKGHLMVLEEDHPSTNYLSLLRYFVSHHYNDKLATIIYDVGYKWKHLVSPPLKKEEKIQSKDGTKSEIAWRYDQMTMKMSNMAIDERISYVDISREVANPDEELLKIYQYPSGSPYDIYKQIEQSYLNAQIDEKDASTKKLLLTSLPAYLYKDQSFSEFLKAVRCLTRSSNLFTLITVPNIISSTVRNKLIKYSDYYLQIGRLGKGYEDFTGSLSILKQVECGALRSSFRGQTVWGLKGGRKELHIEGLYQQPAESQTTKQSQEF